MAIQKTNLLVLNSVKNLAQFAVGLGLAVATFGFVFELWHVLAAAVSLVLIYFASYIYNDIADLEDDKKDPFKMRFKPIARGDMKVESARMIMGGSFLVGFVLSYFVGLQFLATVALISVLNFVYSSPYIRYKSDSSTFAISIFLLEFFKFATGWLAVADSFDKLPLLFVASISLIYIVFGRAYKKKLTSRELFQDNVISVCAVTGILLFVVSILRYDFKFQMLLSPILFMIVAVPWAIFRGKEKLFERTFYVLIVGTIILFIVAALFYATPLGIFGAVNAKLNALLPQLTSI